MPLIKVKEKNCAGKGAATNYAGCGDKKIIFRYGLCQKCYGNWLYTTPEGRALIEKSTIKAHKKVIIEDKKETREKKKELMSVDEYRADIVQPIFNEIARLIDYNQPCIATGYYTGKMNGGHYTAVGTNRTIALNLHNIHLQSFSSNSWKGGDNIKYRNGLLRVYGQEYLDKVEALNSIKPIHLSKSDLDEIRIKALKIRRELRANLIERTPEERIKLREEINSIIGIYD